MQPSQSQPAPSASHFRWIVVALLCAVAFVLYIDRINIMIAAPHLEKEFDLSSQMMGNVLSAFLFGYALGLVPGGWMADRFGPHRVLTLAGLSWAPPLFSHLVGVSAGTRSIFGARFSH